MTFTHLGSFIRDCNGTRLRYDQACLELVTNEKISFWSQYDECEGCMLLETARLPSTGAVVLETVSPVHYAIRNGNGEICKGTFLFGEFGQYTINVTEDTKDVCLPKMTAEPDAALLPILTAAVVLLSMATLWYIVKGIGKRIAAGRFFARLFHVEDNELGSETRVLTSETPRRVSRSRLRSLDIFRGIAIALMVFVNAGGGGYAIFSHSVWNGITVADMVFPWFAFVMGEALVLTLNTRLRTSMRRGVALGLVANRALVLTVIGIVMSSVNASWDTMRVPGVLQRLAFMFLVTAAFECAFMQTGQNLTPGPSLFRDIVAGWKQWLCTLILVGIQVCVTLFVAAPGCPKGYMGPGGLHMSAFNMSLQNCTGGIAGYVDRLLLGPGHLYRGGTYSRMYHTTVPHDPEGILGALSGLLVVQAGAHATRVMLAYNHARARIMRWVFWSIVFSVTGGALCMFSKNGGPIPLNKNLWSVSFCLVAAGTGMFIQAVLYFLVDLKGKWGGRPLYYAGQNALVIYIGSELLKRHFPIHWHVSAPTHSQLLATNAAAMLIWLAVGVALHRRRTFITVS